MEVAPSSTWYRAEETIEVAERGEGQNNADIPCGFVVTAQQVAIEQMKRTKSWIPVITPTVWSHPDPSCAPMSPMSA